MVLVLPLAGIGFSLCAASPLCLMRGPADVAHSLYGTSSVVGFDASGHVAEELKNARYDTYLVTTLPADNLPQHCRGKRHFAKSTGHRRLRIRRDHSLAVLYSSAGSLVRLVCTPAFRPGRPLLHQIARFY